MAKSNEPIPWSLFSAGGMLSAILLPILIVITGILVPFGFAPLESLGFDRVHAAVSGNLLVKLILFGFISLSFFHWAHRFRFALVDMGLRKIKGLIGFACYGSAFVGTVITAALLWRI